ncbi:MAG: carboxypeptidase regulatory-like domain-containing protein, partial [Spirochaetaceae bacterium]|nr:carboxypeptidase regulatory-like domain-containing protein [Spirochaetaceae bacterium]
MKNKGPVRRLPCHLRPLLAGLVLWQLAAALLTSCNDPFGGADYLKFVIEEYPVKIPYIGHGEIIPSMTMAIVGEVITLQVRPDDGYRLQKGSLKVNESSSDISGAGSYWTFRMPLGGAVVTAVFEPVGEDAPKYYIHLSGMVNGTVFANTWSAAEGVSVELSPRPESGYRLVAGTLRASKDDYGEEVPIEGNSFTMPASDVTVRAEFEGIYPDAPRYSISVNAEPDYAGTISCDPNSAAEGESVKVIVSPADFYRLQSIRVTDNLTFLTELEPGTYAFVMPAANVEVWANFEAEPAIYTISGTVYKVETEGSAPVPAEEAKLTLIDSDGHIRSEDMTGNGGRYFIPRVVAGQYTIEASLYGYEPGAAGPFVVDANVSGKDLILQKVGALYTLSGTISTSDDRSAEGTEVRLKQGYSLIGEPVLANDEGNYIIAGVAPGENYTVEARLAGYQSGKTGPFTVSNNVSGKDLSLQKLYRVTGTVYTSDAGPAAGAHVKLTKGGGLLAKPVTADGDGAFEFKDVSDGGYAIEAALLGYVTEKASFTVSGADKTIDLTLQKATQTFTISGKVIKTCGVTNEPAAGATVNLKKADSTMSSTVTDSDGEYSFSGANTGEEYQVEAVLDGYQTDVTDKFRVSGDTTRDMTLIRLAAFNMLTADGSEASTTTMLTLTFDRSLTGLNSNNITITRASGSSAVVTKGTLSGTGPSYTLPVTVTAGGSITVTVKAPSGYVMSTEARNVAVHYVQQVSFTGLSQNGSATTSTTSLTLTFSASVSGLSADNITIDTSGSTAVVSKGTLSGAGPTYTLPVTVTAGGGISVSVSPPGDYSISGGPRTVTVYYAAPVQQVTFESLSQNGSENTSTTSLTLTFSASVGGLSADNIVITPVPGSSAAVAKNGALSGAGPAYTLPVTVSRGGGISVSVSAPGGYSISGTPKTTTVYYAAPVKQVTFDSLSQNGSETKSTTSLTLTFSASVSGLSADNIVITPDTGSSAAVAKNGALSGAGPAYTLPVTVSRGGDISVSVTSPGGYSISGGPKTTTVYYAAPVKQVSFTGLSANGSTTASTSSLTLTFSASISGLSADNITIGTSGSSAVVVKNGALSGTGPDYTLPVTVSRGGNISVSVSPPGGYSISGTP